MCLEVRVYGSVRMRECVCACVCEYACVCACVCVNVRECVCVRLRVYARVCVHVHASSVYSYEACYILLVT